ncbi:hypothetical protein [Streptomyces sp. NPDC101455]|uniref:hypothetical protein n=1 Tax=Streptomyces sp. NPDC101455 TaxID=3366142 RepID=UPI0037FFE55A
MPAAALLSSVFVAAFEQLVSWKYGAAGLIGLLLLSTGVKARNPELFLARIRAASRTASFASWMAGRERAYLRDEWAALLAGAPEDGVVLSPSRRMWYALGFVRAALFMRLSDVVAPLGLLMDWVLSAQSRTNALIALAVGMPVVCVTFFYGLAAAGLLCIYCWIVLRVLVGPLRRMRGIELTSPRRTPENKQ